MAHCGFMNIIIHDNYFIAEQIVSQMKMECEKVVLGIPDELTYARLYGDTIYSAEEKREGILRACAAEDVLIITDQTSYQELYELLHFDALFFGSFFGKAFDDFCVFAKNHHIKLYPFLPRHLDEVGPVDALKMALENIQRHQKIILFGTGAYFEVFMKRYGNYFKPAYALDNNINLHGITKKGLIIYSPDKLREENPENVLIVICTKEYQGIVKQIRSMGDYDYRLMLYYNYVALLEEYALVRKGELEYIKKAHSILGRMLKEFDRVCQKYQLHYYMICGSLIGTMRHHGFIPWDDDVDVAMPREDYEKLKSISLNEWGETSYRVVGYEKYGENAFLDCMPRMLDMSERLPIKFYDKILNHIYKDFLDRPFIDIYVMDNAFDSNRRHMLTMNMMKAVYNLMMGHRDYVDYDEYRPVIPEKTIQIMKFMHKIGKKIPLTLLSKCYDHLSKSANNKKTLNYFMPSCAIRCIERKFKKDYFLEGIRVPFLDFDVTIPINYDGLMEAMGYHGYMQFPRMSIRKPSHYFNSDIVVW